MLSVVVYFLCHNLSYAEVYKCISKGRVSYQEMPCEIDSDQSVKVKIFKDITPDQQRKAIKLLESKLEKIRISRQEKEKMVKRKRIEEEIIARKKDAKLLALEEKVRRLEYERAAPPITVIRHDHHNNDHSFGLGHRPSHH